MNGERKVLNFHSRSHEFGRKDRRLWRRLLLAALSWADGGVWLGVELFSGFERYGGSCFSHRGLDINSY